MATATITSGSTERIAEWVSGQVIDFLDELHTDIEDRVEAFAGHVSTVITEAALQTARAGLTTMLADLGARSEPAAPGAPEQNVLPLQQPNGGTSKSRPAASPPTPAATSAAAKAGARAPRAPKQGGIATEITAFLEANPGQAFTATGMANGLPGGQRSSGAVDAAAKRMLGRGELAVASESPRKYALPDRH